jgi:hypothetical protein
MRSPPASASTRGSPPSANGTRRSQAGSSDAGAVLPGTEPPWSAARSASSSSARLWGTTTDQQGRGEGESGGERAAGARPLVAGEHGPDLVVGQLQRA